MTREEIAKLTGRELDAAVKTHKTHFYRRQP